MAKINHLPFVKNTQSGNNMHDPQNNAVFEVYFTLPPAIQSEFKQDEAYLTEQVTDISGLDGFNKTVGAGSQKFFGVDASFLNPSFDNTYTEFTINFNLNLRNVTDAWVFKIIRAWARIGYDLADGTRTLMADYMADNLRIAVANRDGTVWRSILSHRILMTNISGLDTLNYTDNEAAKLSVTFRCDYWDDQMA